MEFEKYWITQDKVFWKVFKYCRFYRHFFPVGVFENVGIHHVWLNVCFGILNMLNIWYLAVIESRDSSRDPFLRVSVSVSVSKVSGLETLDIAKK